MVNSNRDFAKQYIELLDLFMRGDWVKNYQFMLETSDFEHRNLMKYVLCNPRLKHSGYFSQKDSQLKIQGPQRFPIEHNYKECCSKDLWGYKCPVKNPTIQLDHEYPYSLGGPTTGSNLRHLCRLHNSLKSNDIHIYPWTNYLQNPPRWLDVQLQKIIHFYSYKV